RPAEARPLQEDAIATYGRLHLQDFIDVADVLTGLTDSLLQLGDPAGARAQSDRAIAIRERYYSPGHPMMTGLTMDRARLEYFQGNDAIALDTCLDAEALTRQRERVSLESLSESESMAYQTATKDCLALAMSLLAAPGPGKASAPSIARVWNDL